MKTPFDDLRWSASLSEQTDRLLDRDLHLVNSEFIGNNQTLCGTWGHFFPTEAGASVNERYSKGAHTLCFRCRARLAALKYQNASPAPGEPS